MQFYYNQMPLFMESQIKSQDIHCLEMLAISQTCRKTKDGPRFGTAKLRTLIQMRITQLQIQL